MANDLNQCTFTGRLGKDPEIRYTPSGDAVASFSMAVGEAWKDKSTGEKKEKTEWVSVCAFGKLAEITAEYLSKGSFILIVGKLRTDKYEKDGQTRYSTKIIANQMQMLGGKSDKPQDEGHGGQDDVEDVPF